MLVSLVSSLSMGALQRRGCKVMSFIGTSLSLCCFHEVDVLDCASVIMEGRGGWEVESDSPSLSSVSKDLFWER